MRMPRRSTSVRRMALALAPHLPMDNFRAEPLERITFPDSFADVVLSSAVLHFAEGDDSSPRCSTAPGAC